MIIGESYIQHEKQKFILIINCFAITFIKSNLKSSEIDILLSHYFSHYKIHIYNLFLLRE